MEDKEEVVCGMKMKSFKVKTFSMYFEDFVRVGPKGVTMPTYFSKWYPKYVDFTVHDDDVWIVTYPKSGTTWTQEMVWCLLNDRNSPEAKLEIMRRIPFLELESIVNPNMRAVTPDIPSTHLMVDCNSWRLLQQKTPPRQIKSHLHKHLLPPQLWTSRAKVVYVSRDPRDVVVSYYFHQIKLEGFTDSFDHFVELFLQEKVSFSPFWTHILEFWEMRHDPRVLFLRFEDMKEDLSSVVRRVAQFLGVEVGEEEVEQLAHHCSFDQMKNNPAANNESIGHPTTLKGKPIRFMRKGQVGDWRNHLSESQLESFKEWTARNLKGSDFPYYQDY